MESVRAQKIYVSYEGMGHFHIHKCEEMIFRTGNINSLHLRMWK